MKKGYPCQLIVSVLVVGLLLALSGEATAAEVPRIQGELTIFSAASLTDAFKEMAAQIEQANPGTKLTFNFAGSPTLRTQLAQGARLHRVCPLSRGPGDSFTERLLGCGFLMLSMLAHPIRPPT